MKKVITYGTFDLLHYGHIRLLERAKALGDYLIVGVTSDDYDKSRGKINNQQSLSERLEAVRELGIADEIIVEEYEGQKIDDIRKYHIDIFTVGTDWEGYFDYLKEYCEVVYLPRTEGVSSTEIRGKKRALTMGLVGSSQYLNKIVAEAKYANGITLSGICADFVDNFNEETKSLPLITNDYQELLEASDAVFIHSVPERHYELIREALMRGKHVLCESPIALNAAECQELYNLAKEHGCILTDAVRTVYSTAFNRMILMVKSGKIGRVVSVDAVCTSLRESDKIESGDTENVWNSMCGWGPTAFLPILELLGDNYINCEFASHFIDRDKNFDSYTKTMFIYPDAVASMQVGTGVKSEGELIISGTKGYVYVPAPWWKTEYFETRYENSADNKRYFYQLDGEGIRNELADFARCVEMKSQSMYITESDSEDICKVIEAFENHKNMAII